MRSWTSPIPAMWLGNKVPFTKQRENKFFPLKDSSKYSEPVSPINPPAIGPQRGSINGTAAGLSHKKPQGIGNRRPVKMFYIKKTWKQWLTFMLKFLFLKLSWVISIGRQRTSNIQCYIILKQKRYSQVQLRMSADIYIRIMIIHLPLNYYYYFWK